MIPSGGKVLDTGFEMQELPTRTYRMQLDGGRIAGFCDGLEAMRQTVFKILNTERYRYVIYSWDFGIETQDLFGKAAHYVCPELKRRITEALMQDKRVLAVTDFAFDTSRRGEVHASFVVQTEYGSFAEQKGVEI